MKDSELVDQMIAKTFSRIQDRMLSRYKEAIADQKFVNSWLRLGLGDLSEPAEPSLEIQKWMCSAPLTDMAVDLLWAIAAVATNETFISSDDNFAAVVDSIDLEEVVRQTGFSPKDIPFILSQMAESLREVIREQITIDVEINCQKFRLSV